MINEVLIYIGAVIVVIWGIAHIVPTRNVVKNFGDISEENQRIITLEWVAEGLALIFIGVLAAMVTTLAGGYDPVSTPVIRACALMLLILGGWTLYIGFKTSVIPIKICPFVLATAAILLLLGTYL